MPDIEVLENKLKKEKIEIISHSYDIIMKAIKTPDFKKWLKALQDNLNYDYDLYHQQMAEHFEEPLGFEIWALGRYLGEEK